MKRVFTLIGSLLLILISSHPALADTIPIAVSKGVSVSLERSLESSDLSEPTLLTGNFGLNDRLLLKCAYLTEEERNLVGGRYAFNERMAVSFEHEWQGGDSSNIFGYAHKFNLHDQLAIAGLLEYGSKSIGLTTQAEYAFTEVTTAYAGFEYVKPDQGDAATNLLVGVEFKPVDNFSFYFDYLIPEEGDALTYFGLTYSF